MMQMMRVMIYMISKKNLDEAKNLKQLIIENCNLKKRNIGNTFRKYKKLNAYSTWIATRMPIEFDICVMSNILYFNQHYKLQTCAERQCQFVLY